MIQEHDIKTAFDKFAQELETPFHLEGIFFDMDGVLFNSMPLHAKSWIQTFSEYGISLPEIEPYMNEGSTAPFTVKRMFKKYLNQVASEEVCEEIKNRKHEIMANMPTADVMDAMPELLKRIADSGIDCWVVTGSAQKKLIDRLVKEFEPVLTRDRMITAHEVVHGKPHPEPYLNAMKKSGYSPSSAIVIENAPLGVQSARAAGLFTIAVNTGPLEESVLLESGANLVLPNTLELSRLWMSIQQILK